MSVTLDAFSVAVMSRLGDGVLSEGIRRAARIIDDSTSETDRPI